MSQELLELGKRAYNRGYRDGSTAVVDGFTALLRASKDVLEHPNESAFHKLAEVAENAHEAICDIMRIHLGGYAAAVPDLLGALQTIAERRCLIDNDADERDQMVEVARAAIAKTEGATE